MRTNSYSDLSAKMALGNGSTPNGGVSEKAPVVNGTNMETLPRTGKQVFIYSSVVKLGEYLKA